MTDEDLAARLADGAGRLLMALREDSLAEGRALGLLGDRVSNSFLMTSLAQWRPADPILSEESPDCDARLGSPRVWIIDPLDGTREYGEGRDDWAVHVALAVDGRPQVGAIALPARGQLFRSDACPTPPPSGRTRPLMLVSRTRPPGEAVRIAELVGADMVPMGSAGAKAASVIAGDADIYYHAGGQHEWDNCAPAAVALGAGLHASRVDGAPLVYNRADTLIPDLVIARPEWAGPIVAHCRR